MDTFVAGLPIESAPRDGSEFLAYDPVAKCYDVVKMGKWFNGELRVCSTQSDGEYGPFDDDFRGDRATLWWALPSE